MNRRNFLSGAGAAAAATAAVGIRPRILYGQSSTPNPAIYNALIAAHSIAVGHVLYGAASASDWTTVQNAANVCLADWQANNRDAGVRSAVSSVSPSFINSGFVTGAINTQPTMNIYDPRINAANIQLCNSYVSQNPSLLPNIFASMQSSGMAGYLYTIVEQSGLIASTLAAGGGAAVSREPTNPGHAEPLWRNPVLPPVGGKSGGGLQLRD